MIAANYRKHPKAMALQLVLEFGRCTWHTARPTQRAARAVRAARGDLVKTTPQLVRWVKRAVPAWWKVAKRKAVELANQVREACGVFVWDQEQPAQPQQAKAWNEGLENRQCRATFDPFWLQVMPRWNHAGLGENLYPAMRHCGYRG